MKLHPNALKVGKKYDSGYFEYRDIKYDPDMWAKADEFLPAELELCKVKTKDGKTKMGWWCGNFWEGLKIKITDEIIYWKRWVE